MTNKKFWGTRYFIEVAGGFTLCKDSLEELKASELPLLGKNYKGKTARIIKQDMYTRENVNTVIEEIAL